MSYLGNYEIGIRNKNELILIDKETKKELGLFCNSNLDTICKAVEVIEKTKINYPDLHRNIRDIIGKLEKILINTMR